MKELRKKSQPITFRMYAGVKMNRSIDPERDYISPGGYEMVIGGQKLRFDFEDYYGSRSSQDDSVLEFEAINPMYDEYPNLYALNKSMFKKITEISEFFVFTGEAGETDLKPVSLEYVSFVFPYEQWKNVQIPQDVLHTACLTSNIE